MIGLSTYGYSWRMADSAERPMTVLELVGETERFGLSLLQICDYPRLETFSDAELDEVKRAGDAAGIAFELGTRGVDRPKLMTYLELASRLDATYLRTMLGDIDSVEARDKAIAALEESMPDFVDRGITIAIETHELVATSDLRFVIAALKIDDDLERIGDLAVNIAEAAIRVNLHGGGELPPELARLRESVSWMLASGLKSFVQADPELARRVHAEDREVNRAHGRLLRSLSDDLAHSGESTERSLGLIAISHAIERVGDHVKNIAEDVIYLVEGKIVRHSSEAQRAAGA